MAPKRRRHHQAQISYRCGGFIKHSDSGIQKSTARECKTSFSSFHRKDENAIAYQFENSADGHEFMTRLESLVSSPFVRARFSAQQDNLYHVVGTCRMGLSFIDWWKKNFENFWELSKDDQGNYKIIALTEGAKKLFRNMLEGLKVYHNASIGHGNLRNGVMVDPEGEIQFFNEVFESRSFEELLLDDLNSFRYLVGESMDMVGQKLSNLSIHIKAEEHPAVKSFEDLYCSNLSQYRKSSEKLMEFDFYVRNNPLFMNTKESFMFLKKVVDIREFCRGGFKNWLWLDAGDTDLGAWGTSINHPPLKEVFDFEGNNAEKSKRKGNKEEYNEPKGAVLFVRNALWHAKDKHSRLDYGIITNMILEDLPFLLPKLWLALIQGFGEARKFINYSGGNLDLIGFLRKEPSCMD